MIKATLDSVNDVPNFLNENSLKITNTIVKVIESTYKTRKKSALILELSIMDANGVFEVSLPNVEWEKSLQNCITYYSDNNMYDEAIDTFSLLEKIKERKRL
jgi:hypothetical protein